jgi:hypothetical protein
MIKPPLAHVLHVGARMVRLGELMMILELHRQGVSIDHRYRPTYGT